MTDEQICKALKCYANPKGSFTCDGCAYEGVTLCRVPMAKDTLDLINRQKAKIEALLMDNSQLQTDNFNAIENAKDLSTAVKRWKETARREANYVDIAKSEAIKEFAERLKDVYRKDASLNPLFDNIDNLVEEMTDGK